jgi:hypothetical protein
MGMTTTQRKFSASTTAPPLSSAAPAPAGPTAALPAAQLRDLPRESGGVCGPEPTRFGDWERNGRCIDF